MLKVTEKFHFVTEILTCSQQPFGRWTSLIDDLFLCRDTIQVLVGTNEYFAPADRGSCTELFGFGS